MLTYAVITPVRNEVENLRRLDRCLRTQTILPHEWIVVENGSTDATPLVAAKLARATEWTRVVTCPSEADVARGGPIVRAFHAGFAELASTPDVVVKLDADTSMKPDYFERLLAEFARDPRLGIASGMGYEKQADGTWRQRHGTGTSVWGACRAYRWQCLEDVLPLEERMGWDGIDQHKANMRGWTTHTFLEIPFQHHRFEGERDGARWRAWSAEGGIAHYMSYRPSYLVLRALHHTRTEPSALAMLWGYVAARFRREPPCPDAELRAYVRDLQSPRNLPLRIREALRPREALEK